MPWSFFFRPARSWIALRLGRVLLALVLVFGPALAFSATHSGSTGHVWNSAGYTGVSAVAACSAYVSVAYPGMVIDGYNSATGFCTGHWPSDPNQCGGSCNIGVVELSDCVVGYEKQPDGTCKKPQPNCPAAGQPAPGGNSATGTSPTQTILNPQVCVGGCAYTYSSYWTGAKPGQNGGYPAQYTGLSSTGSACSGDGTPSASQSSPADPPKQCGVRQYSGTVNGVSVCIDYPTQTTGSTSTSTTTDAPASGVPATTNSSTTTSTTCDGTTCTTTTVVAVGGGGAGGSGAGSGASGAAASPCQSGQASTGASVQGGAGTCTSTTSEPQDKYCEKNPTAAQCKKDSASGGGSCDAPPSCDGDAISCAILQQQWNMRCELQKHDDSTDLGAKLANGQDPLAGKLPTPGGADQVDMSQKFANVDDMGFAAQCLPDVNVNLPLPGGSWNLHMDMTPLCHLGKLFGYLNMLSTLMLCAYMLKGSF